MHEQAKPRCQIGCSRVGPTAFLGFGRPTCLCIGVNDDCRVPLAKVRNRGLSHLDVTCDLWVSLSINVTARPVSAILARPSAVSSTFALCKGCSEPPDRTCQ